MKVINAIMYVELTETERKTLSEACTILNELYEIIDENDCERATNILMNESYGRRGIALAVNILRTFAPASKLEIAK